MRQTLELLLVFLSQYTHKSLVKASLGQTQFQKPLFLDYLS